MVSLKRIVLIVVFFAANFTAYSQCAMCKAVLESNMENGGTAAAGINNGILYLMFIPYILIGSVGYFIYRHYKKNNKVEDNI
ncbi:MAG: hypothetical protein P8Q14_11460 [Vicingaceae bacterium]|nr:hypothetical protein [Vicingaceae bacterium]